MPNNDLELMLQTIGDLEFTRRRLLLILSDQQKELETFKNNSDQTEEPEASSDCQEHKGQQDQSELRPEQEDQAHFPS